MGDVDGHNRRSEVLSGVSPQVRKVPTYFEVKWPSDGYQPGEINTTTLLTNQVRIRPTCEGYTYIFGDGTGPLQTDSAGGVYPDGDVTHVYAKAGTYTSLSL